MKKDIEIRKVTDIAMAIVPPTEEEIALDANSPWEVHFINLKQEEIRSLLLNSTGYDKKDGKDVKTATFRHFYESVPAMSCIKVELLPLELHELTQEFMISFSYDGYLFDKKYIFVKGSLDEQNFTMIPILERRGVMIK